MLADSIRLRADDGSVIDFLVSPEVAKDAQHPNTASHLRQHMTAVDRVMVTYRSTPEGPQAVQITDS